MRSRLGRLLAAGVVSIALAAAQPGVYVTEHGKSYHRSRTCMALSHAREVYQVSEYDAVAHGLKKCAICWRQAKPKKDSGWMKKMRER